MLELAFYQQEIADNLRLLWADHGDAISVSYAGTPALKGDVIRYGGSTITGSLRDGWNSIERYYINNFEDGDNQDALDLFLGVFKPTVAQPARKQKKKKISATLFAPVIQAKPGRNSWFRGSWLMVYLVLITLLWRLFLIDAESVVNAPSFVDEDEIKQD
jgi:hypothetical protein